MPNHHNNVNTLRIKSANGKYRALFNAPVFVDFDGPPDLDSLSGAMAVYALEQSARLAFKKQTELLYIEPAENPLWKIVL